jgi:hypothetical protein
VASNQTTNILLRVRVAAPAGTQITNCAIVETAGASLTTSRTDRRGPGESALGPLFYTLMGVADILWRI